MAMNNSTRLIRNLAIALSTGAVLALLTEAVLRGAVMAPPRPSPPWWFTIHLMEHGYWIAFGLLWYLVAPLASRMGTITGSYESIYSYKVTDLFRPVGFAMALVPLLWILAVWLVVIVKVTLVGSWATEGRIFTL